MQDKRDKEYRSYMCDLETREDENHGAQIVGVPIVFNQAADLGFYTEIIAPGALDGTDMKDVRLLVNHDETGLPLARSRNNNANSTMQLTVEADGLHIRADLDTEHNARAEELWSASRRGDVSGMSFAFVVDADKWDDLESEKPTRTITKIGKIFEVSAVTWPAYEQTSIDARSLESVQRTLESEKEALESAKKVEALRRSVLERSKAWKNA